MDLKIRTVMIGMTLSVLLAVAHGAASTATAKSVSTTRKGKGSEQTHCECRGFLSKNSPVCGTDLVTYNTSCLLAKAMEKNTTLGMKCNTKCPCKEHKELDRCTPTMRVFNPIMVASSPNGSKVPRRSFKRKTDPRFVKKYCLTDGTEWTRNTIFCALGSKPDVGIRCMGFCKQCKTINSACPAKLLQNIPLQDEASE